MKNRYKIFSLSFLLIALVLMVWVIIKNDGRIIFPVVIISLMGISYFFIKYKINEGSIIFNTQDHFQKFRKLFRISFIVILLSLIFFNNYYFKYENFYIVFVPLFLISFLVIIFLSPKQIAFSNQGVRFLFWQIKWTKLKDYNLKNEVLYIKSSDGKDLNIKGINKKDYKAIEDILKNKLNALG